MVSFAVVINPDNLEHRVRAALAARAKHLSTGECATLLGISPNAVNRMCARGTIKAFRATGISHWRIPVEGLFEFVSTNDWILNWQNLNLEL